MMTWFSPSLMHSLPTETRWPYVNEFERALTELVLSSIGGKIISQTEGKEPGYDLIVETDEGQQKVEIKSTDHHEIFIEGGRYDMEAAGLSATESDIYLILSRDQQITPEGIKMIGKVRVCFTYLLVEEYVRISQYAERSFLPSSTGPGCRGIRMDPKRDLPHIWIGDIECQVDRFGNAIYNTATFVRQPTIALQARKEYNQGIRLMQKFDSRHKENHE